jgi:DNA replication terminus site-binding protein
MLLENKIKKLHGDYLNMKERIKLLAGELNELSPENCVCFSLPNLSKEDLGDEPNKILVETLTGQHALNMAIEHLSQHELKESVPGIFAPRLPGTIVLNVEEAIACDIKSRINDINALKVKFAISIKRLSPSTDVRFEIVKEVLPNLIKKTAVRKILLAPEQCHRIGFTWKRFYSVRKKTPEEWDKYLENAIVTGKHKGPEWEQAIEMERQVLRNNNDASVFISRRPIRITPAMNLNVTMNNGKTKATTVVAHSPLWVINQAPSIRGLKTFDANGPKRKINERNEELLIPRLHLYR